MKRIDAGVLEIAYLESGPAGGPPVFLMHGFPYDVHAYDEVAPVLAAAGCRVIVPYLRGFGPTRFLSNDTPRSGEQAALGADLLALMDALGIPRAVLAGYDWGGRAACVVAALWPQRCAGLVSFNSYNIQDIARAMEPDRARKRAHALVPVLLPQRARPRRTGREPARVCAAAVEALVADLGLRRGDIRAQRRRLRQPGFRRRRDPLVPASLRLVRGRPGLCRHRAAPRGTAAIGVPTITFDGANDGVRPPADAAAHGHRFTGLRSHHVMPNVGHNMPQEVHRDFADAVLELVPALRE